MKRLIAMAMAAGVLSASAVSATEPGQRITQPEWLRTPTASDLEGVFPAAALRSGISGRASISCVVNAEGLLTDCTVVKEEPSGLGFGNAALLLSKRFLMRPKTVDGKPVGGATARIPINFVAPGPRTGTKLNVGIVNSILVLDKALWLSAPSMQDVERAYPLGQSSNVAGHVVLRCRVNADGALADCMTLSRNPDDGRFTTAARALAKLFKLGMEAPDDVTLKKVRVDVPIYFPPSGQPLADRTIANPDWTRTLPADKMQQVFPSKAADAGLKTGRAVLDCVADAQGMMTNCQVLSEDPASMDFGPAAVRVASAMGVNPWLDEGLPADGAHVKFALRLNDKEPAPAATDAPTRPAKPQ